MISEFALVALSALSGCGGGEDVTTRSLSQAKRLWQRAGLQDYNLEWTTTGARNGHYLVFVRGGQVRQVRLLEPDGRQVIAKPGEPSAFGVDGLFRTIEEEADQATAERPFGAPKGTRILLRFWPDERLGYPKRYRREVVGGRLGLSLQVVAFDSNPPLAIPALNSSSPPGGGNSE